MPTRQRTESLRWWLDVDRTIQVPGKVRVTNGGAVCADAIIVAMNKKARFPILLLVAGLFLAAGCEPLVPSPTAQVIIVTATASPAPTGTPTPSRTPTPDVTETPVPSITPTAALCPETAGQVIVFDRFDSAIAGRNMPYRVYIPPCYFESLRRYPVVYLLHGASNDDTHWEDIGFIDMLDRGLRLGQYPPMVIVMPYGAQLLANSDFPPDPSMETYLLEELMPRIEQDFCTYESRDYRAIGGISRGGYWALSIAFRHPDLFGAVGGHSAALDTDRTPPTFNPLNLAQNAPFLDTLRIYLDNGGNDPVRQEMEMLSNRLVERQIPHEYVIDTTGDHSDAYWSAQLGEYLPFYGGTAADGWPRDVRQLPSCLEPSPQ